METTPRARDAENLLTNGPEILPVANFPIVLPVIHKPVADDLQFSTTLENPDDMAGSHEVIVSAPIATEHSQPSEFPYVPGAVSSCFELAVEAPDGDEAIGKQLLFCVSEEIILKKKCLLTFMFIY